MVITSTFLGKYYIQKCQSLRAGIKEIITFTFLCILFIQKSESASVVWSKWLQCVSSWQMVCGIKRRLALATKAHHWFCHFNSSSSSFVLMMMKVSYQCENQIILHKIRFWFERVWLVATSGASVSLCVRRGGPPTSKAGHSKVIWLDFQFWILSSRSSSPRQPHQRRFHLIVYSE